LLKNPAMLTDNGKKFCDAWLVAGYPVFGRGEWELLSP